MINIEATLLRAASSATAWTSDEALKVANNVNGGHSIIIDWDRDAGESWIRVIDFGHVIAYVSVEIPLAFIEQGRKVSEDLRPAVEVLVVDDFNSAELSCSLRVAGEVFSDTSRFEEIELDRFSVNDLWYATV